MNWSNSEEEALARKLGVLSLTIDWKKLMATVVVMPGEVITVDGYDRKSLMWALPLAIADYRKRLAEAH